MTEERVTSFPKNKIKVLLLENIHPQAHQVFESEGYPVESLTESLPEDQLRYRLQETYILGVRSRTKLSEDLLKEARKLIAVGAFGVGTEQIDLDCSTKSGIAVFNAPFSNTRSVAELALGEMIMLQPRIFDKSKNMHVGIWDKSAKSAHELRGKTLGIIGYGKIGSQLSVLAEGLGMDVIFYNTSETLALGNSKSMNSMEEVLEKADVVSLHVSGKPENKNMISTPQFEIMKDGVLFLNLSRGFVVNQEALAIYIKTGKIGGAAIDVFPTEPISNQEEFKSPLRGLPNVILTPHIGGSTEEAQEDIGRFVATKLVNFVNTGDTRLSVNLPNIELPVQVDSHRFLHLHRNVPGVMANVNAIFAERGINIVGQYLKTNEDIGYVITDVNRVYDRSVLCKLRKVPQTIKFRVLY